MAKHTRSSHCCSYAKRSSIPDAFLPTKQKKGPLGPLGPLGHGHLQFSICMKLKGFCGIRVTAVRVPSTKRKGRRKPIKIAASAMEPLWKRNNTPRTFAKFRLVLVVEPPQQSIYLYIISTGVNHPKSRTKPKELDERAPINANATESSISSTDACRTFSAEVDIKESRGITWYYVVSRSHVQRWIAPGDVVQTLSNMYNCGNTGNPTSIHLKIPGGSKLSLRSTYQSTVRATIISSQKALMTFQLQSTKMQYLEVTENQCKISALFCPKIGHCDFAILGGIQKLD